MLQPIFNENAAKKAINLSINSELISKAKELDINLSATFERVLENEVRKAERSDWLKNNKKAIHALNELADRNGLFSDAHRCF
ncbi:MAG: type II toxin-antitoxin system CcdA family antitoxin [Gammaproteobacteria bacterium]|nr:type II toxin-antitoxin system CcdA family antitoxin [Gammaproteobacteria bacterium]NNJ83944.1 type II toxin-antitoxin system CcdA family antitoxin [Gammaproteobacteria bacterium]